MDEQLQDSQQETVQQAATDSAQAANSETSAEQNSAAKRDTSSLHRVLGVGLELRVELARVNLPIREILDLTTGSVVSLKRAVGEPVDVFVNDKLLARGEVVVIDDLLGVRVTDIVSPEPDEESVS